MEKKNYLEKSIKDEMKSLLERIEKLDEEIANYEGQNPDALENMKEDYQKLYDNKKEAILNEFNETIEASLKEHKEQVEELNNNFEKEKEEIQNKYDKKVERYETRLEELEADLEKHSDDPEYQEMIQGEIEHINEKKENFISNEGQEMLNSIESKEAEKDKKIENMTNRRNEIVNGVREELSEINIEAPEYDFSKIEEEKEEQEKEDTENLEEIDAEEKIKANEEKINELSNPVRMKVDEPEEVPVQEPIRVANIPQPQAVMQQQRAVNTAPRVTNPILMQEEEQEKEERIKILYSAKHDNFLVTSESEKVHIIERKNLMGIDMDKVAVEFELSDEDLGKLDKNMVEILANYDQINGSRKLDDYIDLVVTDKDQLEFKDEIIDESLEIEYNLKGIYDNRDLDDEMTKEAKKEIMRVADEAKKSNAATVKKGLKVTLMSLVEKIKDRFSKNEKLLPEGNEGRKPEKTEKLERNNSKEISEDEKQLQELENVVDEMEKRNEKDKIYREKATQIVENDPQYQARLNGQAKNQKELYIEAEMELMRRSEEDNSQKENNSQEERVEQTPRQKFTDSIKAEPSVDDVLKALKDRGFTQVDRNGKKMDDGEGR